MENIKSFVHKGVKRESCRDVAFYRKLSDGMIIGLCDGVTTQENSKAGAAKISESIADELEHGKINDITKNELKYITAYSIKSKLYELSEERGCKVDSFASTLMMVIIPTEMDYFWSIHIGDGDIGMVDDNREILLLSPAQNGITKKYTYTTASNNLLKVLRVKKHIKKGGELFMMTDGISNELYKNKHYIDLIRMCDWIKLENELLKNGTNDDIGLCSIKL